jgi:transcriptional regulator with XRE-family HTH domain
MIARKINTRLKLALLERGISQLQLAHDLRYDPSLVSKVIHGWERPSGRFIADVAHYLDRPASELFSGTDVDQVRR